MRKIQEIKCLKKEIAIATERESDRALFGSFICGYMHLCKSALCVPFRLNHRECSGEKEST